MHQDVPKMLEMMLRELKYFKDKLHTWARDHIQQKFLDAARNYNFEVDGKVVQKFQQIGVAYSRDSSQEMHKTMFNILYLSFKHEPGWAKHLKEMFMREENLAYMPGEP